MNINPTNRPDKVPGWKKESKKDWAEGKDMVLAELQKAGEEGMASPVLIEKMQKAIEFRSHTAPWGIIKALLDQNHIHCIVYPTFEGKKNVRVLFHGPKTGGYVRIATEKPKPAPAEELPKPRPAYPVGAMGGDADWKEKMLKMENALTGDWGNQPKETTKPVEVVKEVAQMTVEQNPIVKEPVIENADPIEAEMRKVAQDTIRLLLKKVDVELEKALSPNLKAQLRMASVIAKEANLPESPDSREGAMSQRDKLKAILTCLDGKTH